MTIVLIRNWWALALRGVAALLLGLAAFIVPGVTVGFLVALFGVYAFVDGILALIAGVRAVERHERFLSLIAKGLLGMGAGLLAFILPGATLIALLYLIALWAIITGVFEISAALHLHRAHGEWLLLLNGALSVLLGALFIVWPRSGLVVLLWWIGAYGIIFGLILLVLACRLRSRHVKMPAS